MCHKESFWADSLIQKVWLPSTSLPHVLCLRSTSIFYSNCVCSVLCLSCWTIISRKANTSYPQNSELDCSLNIWRMSESVCLRLHTSSDVRYWGLWLMDSSSVRSHINVSEIGRNWVLQHFSTTVTTKQNEFNSVCKNLNAHLSGQFLKAAIRDEELTINHAYDTGIEVQALRCSMQSWLRQRLWVWGAQVKVTRGQSSRYEPCFTDMSGRAVGWVLGFHNSWKSCRISLDLQGRSR